MKLLLILFLSITPVLAKNKYNFGIGVGMSYANNYIGNKTTAHGKNGKYGANFFPALTFQYKGFAIRGLGAEYSLNGRRSLFDLKFNIRYFGPKYENDYIAKRNASFFGGATLRLLFLSFRYNTDLSSKSNGAIYDIFTMFPFRISKSWMLMPKSWYRKVFRKFC